MALDKKTEAELSQEDNRASEPLEPRDSPIGDALRAAYQNTVSEAIPVEMLDLLSKLK